MNILLNFDKNKEREGPVTHYEFEKMANYRENGQFQKLVILSKIYCRQY